MQSEHLILIFGMALMAAAPRLLPIIVFSSVEIKGRWQIWLYYVPIAVIGALLGPMLFVKEKSVDLSWSNVDFWVGIPTIVIAIKSRNLTLTIISGVAMMAAVKWFLA